MIPEISNQILQVEKPRKRRRRRKEKYNSTKRRKMRSRFLEVDPHCFYCRKPLTLLTSSLDHVIPLSKGGEYKNNLVLACHKCNNKKANEIVGTIDMESVLRINRLVEKLRLDDIEKNGGNRKKT